MYERGKRAQFSCFKMIELGRFRVEWLIIDESDKLFETGIRGFRDQLAVIYQACDAENIKRAMFSATNTVELTRWCRKNLNNIVTIVVGHRYSRKFNMIHV